MENKQKKPLAVPNIKAQSQIIPDKQAQDLFTLFASGFKLGAIFGANLPKQKKKTIIKFLESPEAQTLIYGLLIKESDFK